MTSEEQKEHDARLEAVIKVSTLRGVLPKFLDAETMCPQGTDGTRHTDVTALVIQDLFPGSALRRTPDGPLRESAFVMLPSGICIAPDGHIIPEPVVHEEVSRELYFRLSDAIGGRLRERYEVLRNRLLIFFFELSINRWAELALARQETLSLAAPTEMVSEGEDASLERPPQQ